MWTRWGHGEHCMPPVRPGAKPQPKSILVNFRTIMKLYGHGAIQSVIWYMLTNFTKFSIDSGMLAITVWPIQKQILLICLQQTLGAWQAYRLKRTIMFWKQGGLGLWSYALAQVPTLWYTYFQHDTISLSGNNTGEFSTLFYRWKHWGVFSM